MNSFYNETELKEIGFKSIGRNVLISKKASIYSADNISVADNVRIDDFCILSGKIDIGSNVHIAAYVGIFSGKEGVIIEDFVGISARTLVYAISDDYSGEYLTNPTIPTEYKNVVDTKLIFKKHSLVGAGSLVLPGATIEEGCSFGAMSLINKQTEPWAIYVGAPIKKIKDRSKNLIELEKQFRKEKK